MPATLRRKLAVNGVGRNGSPAGTSASTTKRAAPGESAARSGNAPPSAARRLECAPSTVHAARPSGARSSLSSSQTGAFASNPDTDRREIITGAGCDWRSSRSTCTFCPGTTRPSRAIASIRTSVARSSASAELRLLEIEAMIDLERSVCVKRPSTARSRRNSRTARRPANQRRDRGARSARVERLARVAHRRLNAIDGRGQRRRRLLARVARPGSSGWCRRLENGSDSSRVTPPGSTVSCSL